ncbi:hypothetical protein C7999DRAFT_31463 [Corynascus novoguineensis]|uniref:Uncharacterized protein n=1 Tax=Corynascus novoguineensis TaxID=1126955 RepID=A0AAN7HPU0_9PEZI|nr:hypothetical protein C7999DRAFT_31463 [Corynascus novoguineensis]
MRLGKSSSGGGGFGDMAFKIALIICTFLSMLFMAIALSSASSPGQLESLNIVHFNTSTLGQGIVSGVADKAKDGCEKVDKTLDDIENKGKETAEDIANKGKETFENLSPFRRRDNASDGLENRGFGEVCEDVVEKVEDTVNNGIKSFAQAIGIKEYYSAHIGSLCEGYYKPSYNDKDAKPDIETCSRKFKAEQSELSKLFDKPLGVGSVKKKLSDTEFGKDIQETIDMIPNALAKTAYPFLFNVLLLAAGFLFAVAVLVFEYLLTGAQVIALYGAMGCLGLGSFFSFVGAIAVTAIGHEIKRKVNEHGGDIGIQADTNAGVYVLLWGSLIFSCIALGLLIMLWIVARKGKRAAQEEYAEKNGSDSSLSEGDNHGYVNMQTHGGRGD